MVIYYKGKRQSRITFYTFCNVFGIEIEYIKGYYKGLKFAPGEELEPDHVLNTIY